jgi:superfamily I DNA/RNA helicase
MHRSKGLEAKNVFIIEAQLCPAFYAMQPWQKEQELNLMYVARTRAKEKLIYVNDWISDVTYMPLLQGTISGMGL